MRKTIIFFGASVNRMRRKKKPIIPILIITALVGGIGFYNTQQATAGGNLDHMGHEHEAEEAQPLATPGPTMSDSQRQQDMKNALKEVGADTKGKVTSPGSFPGRGEPTVPARDLSKPAPPPEGGRTGSQWYTEEASGR